jgi:hypothetical protein
MVGCRLQVDVDGRPYDVSNLLLEGRRRPSTSSSSSRSHSSSSLLNDNSGSSHASPSSYYFPQHSRHPQQQPHHQLQQQTSNRRLVRPPRPQERTLYPTSRDMSSLVLEVDPAELNWEIIICRPPSPPPPPPVPPPAEDSHSDPYKYRPPPINSNTHSNHSNNNTSLNSLSYHEQLHIPDSLLQDDQEEDFPLPSRLEMSSSAPLSSMLARPTMGRSQTTSNSEPSTPTISLAETRSRMRHRQSAPPTSMPTTSVKVGSDATGLRPKINYKAFTRTSLLSSTSRGSRRSLAEALNGASSGSGSDGTAADGGSTDSNSSSRNLHNHHQQQDFHEDGDDYDDDDQTSTDGSSSNPAAGSHCSPTTGSHCSPTSSWRMSKSTRRTSSSMIPTEPSVPNDSSSSSPRTMEIAPNVHVPVRPSTETYKAIQAGDFQVSTCFACSATLVCVDSDAYVLCPDCQVVSPATNNTSSSASQEDSCLGVGTGLKREWCLDILSS